ncbi:hypothetical protein ASD48_39145 [Streptomyces sp. Root1310]|nr:hypothetical protein ASD48_39145 [Streptomyces sp. Root1310]
MAEPVRVRRLPDQQGQKLQQIVCRGSTGSVRYRRAMILLASAGGNRVPVIAQLVQADEDPVRDVIHRFNEIGLACLNPTRWAGGRPRQLGPDDEDFVIQTAITCVVGGERRAANRAGELLEGSQLCVRPRNDRVSFGPIPAGGLPRGAVRGDPAPP